MIAALLRVVFFSPLGNLLGDVLCQDALVVLVRQRFQELAAISLGY